MGGSVGLEPSLPARPGFATAHTHACGEVLVDAAGNEEVLVFRYPKESLG
jgi:hypothetical protein